MGAYQEILGDLHNLLGDTHAVHVSLDGNDAVVLDAVIKGDTVRDVLAYVEFDTAALMAKLRSDVETAVRGSRFDVAESGRLLRFYEEGLNGITSRTVTDRLSKAQDERSSSFLEPVAGLRNGHGLGIGALVV